MKNDYFTNFKENDQYLLAKNLLKYIAPGRFLNFGNFNPQSLEDVNNTKKVADILKNYI